MRYCFDADGFHTGWIEDERALGRSDFTAVQPPAPTPGKRAQWDGAAWHLTDAPTEDQRPERIAAVWAAADAFAQAGMDPNSRFSLLDLDREPDCPAWRKERIAAVKAWWKAIWYHYEVVRQQIQAGADTHFDPAIPGTCPFNIWQIAASEP
jgi:hypothetical protein